jgi:hypothetical protein
MKLSELIHGANFNSTTAGKDSSLEDNNAAEFSL